jgi:hypothetical protein
MSARTYRRWLGAGFVLVMTLCGTAFPAWCQVEEKATEEILPGVRVRSSGEVTIQARPQPCDPPCPEPEDCRGVCRDAPCGAEASELARCMSCVWECSK